MYRHHICSAPSRRGSIIDGPLKGTPLYNLVVMRQPRIKNRVTQKSRENYFYLENVSRCSLKCWLSSVAIVPSDTGFFFHFHYPHFGDEKKIDKRLHKNEFKDIYISMMKGNKEVL